MSLPADALPTDTATLGAYDRWLRARLLERLSGLRHGALRVVDPLGEVDLDFPLTAERLWRATQTLSAKVDP